MLRLWKKINMLPPLSCIAHVVVATLEKDKYFATLEKDKYLDISIFPII
jgi:hypothetical protein